MELKLQTWREVEGYLERSRGIIMPLGSTEQHGPNGLIGTDAICAEVIARRVGEAADALVGPTINVGMAQHHLAFPGSISLLPSTLIAVIRDHIASLARHGFARFYFINAHGGNIATATAAFSEVYAAASFAGPSNARGVRCKLANWWESPKARAIVRELFPGREGSHATPSEVSVTQFAYPDAIKHPGAIVPGPPSRPFADAQHFRQLFPEGHIGSDPSLAAPEHGARLVEAAALDLAEDYKAFAGAE